MAEQESSIKVEFYFFQFQSNRTSHIGKRQPALVSVDVSSLVSSETESSGVRPRVPATGFLYMPRLPAPDASSLVFYVLVAFIIPHYNVKLKYEIRVLPRV